ncbi:MAG: putative quinol monooxygenase [Myxococcota bacterium]
MANDLYVIARLRAFENRTDDAAKILGRLAEATRKEPGCVQYRILRNQERPAHFTSFEHWRSADAEAAHWKTEHLAQAFAELEGILDGEAAVHKYTSIENGG